MEERHMRMIFSKLGNIRLISHLDMTRAFLRAFVRAGIELKMSEGFSPHPKVSFPMPLSVGMESENEILDFTVSEKEERTPNEILNAMKDQFPSGIEIKKVHLADRKSKDIAFAEYLIKFEGERDISELSEIFSKPCIIKKKTKKGAEKEIDILPGIKKIDFSHKKGETEIVCVLSASGENYLNPEFILIAISEKPEFARIRRIAAFDEKLNLFE